MIRSVNELIEEIGLQLGKAPVEQVGNDAVYHDHAGEIIVRVAHTGVTVLLNSEILAVFNGGQQVEWVAGYLVSVML